LNSLPPNNKSEVISLRIDPERCTGCVVCLKACPARAMRVRRGVAQIITELCVDCGICYQVCPQGAIRVFAAQLDKINRYPYPVAVPHVALFSQFGFHTTPNQVLLALKQVGFKEVVDTSWLCEMVGVATEEFLRAHPAVKPGISPFCPAVVKLITTRFPGLVPNLIPVLSPRTMAAKGLKQLLARRYGWDPSDVGIFYIAPCPASLDVLHAPIGLTTSYLDEVLCIAEVYGPILKALGNLKEDEKIQRSSGAGLSWAALGGQAQQVRVEPTMVAAGFKDVVTILEMLEGGRLEDIGFVEAHICQGGCLSGPLTVENPFRADSVVRKLVRDLGFQSEVDREKIRQSMAKGLFSWEKSLEPHPVRPWGPEPAKAITKMNAIKELEDRLPHSECGLCGCPDCRTFAEDVALGRAQKSDCLVLSFQQRPVTLPRKGKEMTVRELAEKLGLEVAAGAEGLDRLVTGGYISDLLSDVMARIPQGALWITLQVHQNVAAVAVLKEVSAVCLVGGRRPLPETAAKAGEEKIPILLSPDDAFTLAGKLFQAGL